MKQKKIMDMVAPLDSTNMKKDQLLLVLAGIITWAITAYTEIDLLRGPLEVNGSILGYVFFMAAFLPIATGYARKLPKPVRYLLVELQFVVALSLLIVNHGPVAPILLAIWTAQLPDFFSRTASFVQVAISAVLFYLIMVFSWHEPAPLVKGVVYWGIQLFGLACSFARVSEGRARREMERLNQQLQATRVLLEQSSRQDERVRIARDLHDILGHQLTALNLQLEILHHKVTEDLRGDVQQSKQLAKELLGNIRQVVSDQRHFLSLDIRQAVRVLVANLPQVELHMQGEFQLDSVQLAEQLVLCIQEGISNALRHGRANRIDLTFRRDGRLLRIYLDDNGSGLSDTYLQKKGTGLMGMGERLCPYHGKVQLQPLVQGTRLSIELEVCHD